MVVQDEELHRGYESPVGHAEEATPDPRDLVVGGLGPANAELEEGLQDLAPVPVGLVSRQLSEDDGVAVAGQSFGRQVVDHGRAAGVAKELVEVVACRVGLEECEDLDVPV